MAPEGMAWYMYLAGIAAGFVCGWVNVLAGSGSLVTLPVLLAMGLPANVANGTNRIAIVLQNVIGAGSFYQKRMLDWRGGILLSLPTLSGSLVGAHIALNLDEQMMRRTIGALMVLMLITVLVDPKRWLQGCPDKVHRSLNWWQVLLFFAIGIYGGFIQAGIGVFLLAGLVLGVGYDLVRGNAVKVLIILAQSFVALAVFGLNDQVVWEIGVLIALGTMPGAWVATHMAVERGAVFVRGVLIAVVVVSSLDLFGVLALIAELAGHLL
jgi:uncharacterized membrane protein YfcA